MYPYGSNPGYPQNDASMFQQQMGQGMQQSSNFGPQMPSMPSQSIGQCNYTTGAPVAIKARPVASYDEAKAVPTDFMGNILVMTDFSHGCIYTKVLDPVTGSSVFRVYQQIPEQPPQMPTQPQPQGMQQYNVKAEIDSIKAEMNKLKKELGLDSKEVDEK